ncbi:hypothetical protein [Ereboglobus sp. PH5-10]|uniref:hypothetical protein n=1 Tax=Ereboglobus sp. PH5-10 TaxID=2940629 RepID=UPI002407184D|nr:hypothetical protein [Ereboglobus sp. PH5-10]
MSRAFRKRGADRVKMRFNRKFCGISAGGGLGFFILFFCIRGQLVFDVACYFVRANGNFENTITKFNDLLARLVVFLCRRGRRANFIADNLDVFALLRGWILVGEFQKHIKCVEMLGKVIILERFDFFPCRGVVRIAEFRR